MEKMGMPEIYEVTVITANPTGNDRVGSCEIGHYTITGDTLTMVTADGAPLRATNGERITHRLAPEEDAKRVAGRLTLSHWRNQRAQNELVPGFNRPLHEAAPYGGY
jgi:hypothetical protein